MTKKELIEQIRTKKSFLCVGLDPDTDKMPPHLKNSDDLIFEFNRAIIDATAPYCVSFKPNSAFYEAYGLKGVAALEKTILYIKTKYPKHFVIADAKRGDIGNTSAMYAKAFLQTMNADAITVAPYMGKDSIEPFLQYKGKWAIVLALTSNPGSSDFQMLDPGFKELYKHVITSCRSWGSDENMMFVVGATKAEWLKDIRAIIPDYFLLVPGIGAQGGSLEEVCKYGLSKDIGLLVNNSRAIIYASAGTDFAEMAAKEAKRIQHEMSNYIK
jgi:orotidine-5'-phosphate decarboxylase